jgi:hypothetical protein
MPDPATALLADLRTARTFEQAALLALLPILAAAAAALAASRFAARGRVVRGLVHLRPDDAYRRLVVLEAGRAEIAPVRADETLLPSATAWRRVAQHGAALSIDVNAAEVLLHGASAAESEPLLYEPEGGSRQRLLRRDATHVHVVPLRAPGGAVDGMISVEASCPSAIGPGFMWGACAAEIEALADAAAPYLAALPPEPVQGDERDPLLPVVGTATAALVKLLRVFAQQDETLLLSGPTGSGKSRLARFSHERSLRSAGPFVTLDLATVPEELQMAEIFGWRRGAFTGAVADNPGAVGRAAGGTLFIDEIDKLSLRAQAGLLLVLEDRSYRVLGDAGRDRRADVRFVVGTNADLRASVRDKRFREDLYYRIHVLPVRLPPLAERADEIPGWARFMVERRHRERVPDGRAELAADADAVLLGQPWPGNLRQLDNILRRAYTLAAMEHGGAPPREIVVRREHVAHSLDYESVADKPSPVVALRAAAVSFVAEAERRAVAGGALDLDLAGAFTGLVLGAAAERTGAWDKAFRLLGREGLLKGRNHHKVVRRELERAMALCQALDTPALPFTLPSEGEDDP